MSTSATKLTMSTEWIILFVGLNKKVRCAHNVTICLCGNQLDNIIQRINSDQNIDENKLVVL